MKKIFLLIFIASSLFAGKSFISENKIPEYQTQLLIIRRQLKRENATLKEKIELFSRFNTMWDEFQLNKRQLSDYFFNDTEAKKSFYSHFCRKLARAKTKYDRSLRLLQQENEINQISSDTSDDIPDLALISGKSD